MNAYKAGASVRPISLKIARIGHNETRRKLISNEFDSSY